MNNKSKKSKHKSKLSDDLSDIKPEKKVLFNDDIDDNIGKKNSRTDSVGFSRDVHTTRKRKHTKVSRKTKKIYEILDEESQKGRKVKFGKIDIIDVECWKKLNYLMTAEENLDELLKLSDEKKGRIKNVNCTCIII